MKKVIKIDNAGLFEEDVILQDDEELPVDCIEIPCADGFYRPKWDGLAWVEGDSETPIPVEQRIKILKLYLAETDYTVIKIAEGAATVEEYAEVITQRQAWRAEINQLENSVD